MSEAVASRALCTKCHINPATSVKKFCLACLFPAHPQSEADIYEPNDADIRTMAMARMRQLAGERGLVFEDGAEGGVYDKWLSERDAKIARAANVRTIEAIESAARNEQNEDRALGLRWAAEIAGSE